MSRNILMNHDLAAGYHTLTWDGKNNIGQIAAAGVFVCGLMCSFGYD
jgi:flagellar hook assembly protein FlgD